MKKRVLFYTIAVMSVFSLQSCVTNYVVSTPTKYKSDANLEKLNTKISTQLIKALIIVTM
jgi:lipoprotein Spr